MLQVRKLVLAVAAASAFSSGLAHALGLGDVSVKSSLNQPFEAEISLLEVRDLTSVEIKTQLASPEEFSKAGVDRQFFLTGLKFTPVLNANGKNVIRVTSANPVKEPYLNFLVEVLWPNGRLLREYTVLLDPPLYSPQQVIYAPQPASVSPSAPVVQQTIRSSQASTSTAQRQQPTTRATPALQGSEYSVQRNDTLWEVAARVGGNASVHQTMLAIQDLNPNAFLDGNINRMKSGQVLRLPTEQEINVRSRVEAIAQVTQQNTSWKTGRVEQAGAERQLDATHRSVAGAAPAVVEKADSLRLVADAPGQAQQAADQGDGTNDKAVQDQLAVTKELLDSTVLENQDLKSRVDDLNSQLEKLQRLIELKDSQLAQLQNAVDTPIATQDVTPAAGTQLTEANEETAVVAEDTLNASAESVEQVDQLTTVEPVEAVEAQETEALAVEAQPVVEPEPVVEAEVTPPAAIPVQEEKSLIDTVMDDPMLLAAAGGGAVLALLLLLMGISRRNARKEAELYDAQQSDLAVNDVQPAIVEESLDTDFLSASDLNQVENNTDASFADEFDFETKATESQFKAETSDPIAEASSYISFGRFNQAASVLSAAIDQEPQRIDLRLKLVEVYADLEDRDGFARQIQEISEIGGATAELAQIKARYPQMFDVEQVESVAENSAFDDFDLNDLTLDLPEEVKSDEFTVAAELDDLSALLAETESDIKAAGSELSFDADLDLALANDSDAQVEPESLDTRHGDFDLDFDLDAAVTSQPVASESAGVDDLALADLEFDLPAREQAQAPTPSFELDDEFSFEADSQLDSDFSAQLDEVSAELDNLASGLSDDSLELHPTAKAAAVDTLDALSAPETAADSLQVADEFQDLDAMDDDFGILAGTDETATKLDLARAYVEMGDAEGARDILDEVIAEGSPAQQDEAREMITQLG